MKRTSLTIVFLLAWVASSSAQIVLNGTLEQDSGKRIPNTRIIVAGEFSDTTDSKGQFRIGLSRDFIEGERVILKVDKKGWVINHPLDGEWNLPNLKYQDVHTTRVIIVPKGSKKLWTHARIEKHIGLLSDEIAKLKKEGEKPRPIDFSHYLSEWAEEYGFTPAQVKEVFDQWAKQAKKSEDKRTRALGEFYRKNFALAAQYFEEAANHDEAELRRLKKAARLKTLGAYANWKDAGNSLGNLYRFRDALQQYQKAQKLVNNQGDFPKEWAEIRIFTGNTKSQIGIRSEGKTAHKFLNEARQDYIEALEVFTQKDLPQGWAMTQENLGSALSEQGIRTEGEEGARLLAQAVEAFRRAFAVYTQKDLPQGWAITQNNLGNALQEQGIRTEGTEGAALLAQAVEGYHKALEVYTRKDQPQQWAMTQNNLGVALKEQGIRTGGEEGARLLAQAVEAYRKALEVYTQKELPQQWAGTQNNLGVALKEQGIRTEGTEGAALLAQAVEAFRRAFAVYTQKDLPQGWAMTQNNLGNALKGQGIRTGGEEGARLLAQAVEAYRKAIEVGTQKELPQQWAGTQNNLGVALKEQGIRTEGAESAALLAQAVEAFRRAFAVYTRKDLPQDWAMTQNNLGAVLKEQGIRTGGEEGARLLAQAVEAYHKALQVRTQKDLPQDWAMTQNNLGEVYWLLEDWCNAADCFANVLKVYPDYGEAYLKATILYHEALFDFPKAYAFNEGWLKTHPDDLLSCIWFAESQFTTARFAESQRNIAQLLENHDVTEGTKVVLRALNVANLVALQKGQQVPAELDRVQAAISSQPQDFKVDWSFDGVKHFIQQNAAFGSYGEWLLALFKAMEGDNRDAILKELRAVRERFR